MQVQFDKRFSEDAIDGETLEVRREQRKEQLAQFIWSLDGDQQQEFVGKVNQWTKTQGVRVVDAEQSLYDLNAPTKTLRKDLTSTHAFAVPDVVKRTPDQRLESMTKRLLACPPDEQEFMLSKLAGEYWKAGMPVSVDALRRVAAQFLNRAERKQRS